MKIDKLSKTVLSIRFLSNLSPKKTILTLNCALVLSLFICLNVSATYAAAPAKIEIQDVIVKGQVKDAKGDGLPGVSVKIKGTTSGSTTDLNGNYSISAPDNGTLVFSYIGYVNQEVPINGQSTVNIVLNEDVKNLNEVVVTALGIRREKKALTYAVTEIGGEGLTKAREVNLGNALEGRVAGVNASTTSNGPAGSSRVVIRGNGSLNGDNQPLYIVNGVPINNSNNGSPGTYGGLDGGDGLSSINPDDIETISVLKGGTAAALYGSRAANGVILITTKSGKAQKGLGVEFNSTYTTETPLNLTDWQYEYGAGSQGKAPTSTAEAIADGRMSWGAKLDGSSVIQPDGVKRPYSAVKDNIKNFYQTGTTFTNTVAISGGSEAANFRFSASDLDNKAIVPNYTTNHKTFNLNVHGNPSKQISFEANAQYTIEDTHNRVFIGDVQNNPNAGAQLIANSIDVRTLAPGFDASGNEFTWSDYIYATNPYFAVNKIVNYDTRRRFIGSFVTKYNITDYLYARARVGIDQSDLNSTNITPTGIAYNNRGQMSTGQTLRYETNAEAILGFSKTFGRFNVNALAGGNQMLQKTQGGSFNSGMFNVPFYYFIGNGSSQTFGVSYNSSGINSLFASADIGFDSALYLTLADRTDWFTTLTDPTKAVNDNHKNYYSAGLSWVFSESWKSKPSWLTYSKVRASYAQVGGGAPGAYATALTYSNSAQTHLGATLQSINGGGVPNPNLTPYLSITSEAGLEARMFDSRLGFDVTIYDRTTKNDIVSVAIPNSSGFSSTNLNVGSIKNRGVELLINGTPIKQSSFSWDASFNLAYNKNTVVRLAPNLPSFQIPGAQTRTLNGGIYQYEGLPYGMISGNKALTNAQGQIVYNSATGIPIQSAILPLGKGVPPLTLGLNNTFTYKGVSLSFLIDGKFGGMMYSATNAFATEFGLDKRTTANGIRETGIAESGVDQAGKPYTGNVSAQTYYTTTWATLTDQFVTKADFVKLRSVTLGYSLPKSLLSKTFIQAATLSLVGRNLLFIYNAARNIDPESSYANGNAQGLEDFGLPTTRSVGLNLSVKF